MAPPKVSNPRKSAANYRKNPKSAAKKKAYDTAYHSTDERREYRAELSRERYKRKMHGKGGPDLSHTKDGRLVKEAPSRNRARNRGKK
jgi:hypothetical protein